ncbi:uncharacterized protein LOC119686388 [Teleopsis dalmanni]|uniref:uncharacterized protein LOC119681124 n=1 Tax=Teleopsis dalmanni TaxID=139649 RepID=UPI0018CEAACF|nr:uncharacterized protein LOC119681124 [Teleopsis dalmanni]XP_037950150.1 uncharacterized protein LOC119681124 [Teleopsis dalmanni]XP_037956888.1 uncharacterized protein LOC119686388 [Teleopsis dalmanni]XP_037956890.1 uncharacterized protein LOC119686388 [Teleopsis dalmanni]
MTTSAPATNTTTPVTITNSNNNNNATETPNTNTSTAAHTVQQQQQQQQQQHQQSTTRAADEDFNIRFVNLVRTHKCLYDKKVPEYRNRDNQEKSWSLISQETRESVVHCKERWRNLRACLSRYIKQQNSTDPQHKPYYLTEHMAFLLPFLKSTRSCFESGNNNISAFLQMSYQQQQIAQPSIASLQMVSTPKLRLPNEMKHSYSENDDEETADAFEPHIEAALNMQRGLTARSPAPSDTASAITLQNFIPDVQLAELRTPEMVQDLPYVSSMQNHMIRRDSHDGLHEPKRIKTECEATTTANLAYITDNSDMDFFRSILPDIAALTPQQKRKFKIGVLELIDDVVERFPFEREGCTQPNNNDRRRISVRDWRK